MGLHEENADPFHPHIIAVRADADFLQRVGVRLLLLAVVKFPVDADRRESGQ
jgi:hypothetical protein